MIFSPPGVPQNHQNGAAVLGCEEKGCWVSTQQTLLRWIVFVDISSEPCPKIPLRIERLKLKCLKTYHPQELSG